VALFSLFAIVMSYEANCSYEFWYGEPEKFEQKAFDDAWERLVRCRGLFRSGKFEAVQKQLEAYAKDVEVRRARSVQLHALGDFA
jgi:hypothetical protein